MKNEKGYGAASAFWTSLVGTEGGHAITSFGKSSYGKKGDSNWEQVALCEGWANYVGSWKMPEKYLLFSNTPRTGFPYDYQKMFDELTKSGCSIGNLEKCLTVKTFTEYKNLLTTVYASNSVLKDSIISKVDKFYSMK